MLIYRVEHPIYRKGPYGSEHSSISDRLCISHNNINHPDIYMDFNNFIGGKHYCGFNSEELLKKWFYGHRGPLRNIGFKMAIYSVAKKHVIYGNSRKQIAFDLSAAKLKEYKKIP